MREAKKVYAEPAEVKKAYNNVLRLKA